MLNGAWFWVTEHRNDKENQCIAGFFFSLFFWRGMRCGLAWYFPPQLSDLMVTSATTKICKSVSLFFWKTWTTCPAFINKEKRVYKAPETPKSASFRDSSLGGPKGKGTTHVLWGQLVRCLAPANTQSLKSSFRRAINLDTGTSSCLKTLLLRSFHRDLVTSRRCKHHFYIHYCLNEIGIKRIISMKHWYQNTGTYAWFERGL